MNTRFVTGFIILGLAQRLWAGFGVVDQNYLWPDGKIPYAIDASCPNPALFRQAMKMWEEQTERDGKKVIQFVPVEGTNMFDSIICTAIPKSESRFGKMGTVTKVGRWPMERPVEFDPAANLLTYLHELGHVIGLVHEVQRPDRDDSVGISEVILRQNAKQVEIIEGPTVGFCRVRAETGWSERNKDSLVDLGHFPRSLYCG